MEEHKKRQKLKVINGVDLDKLVETIRAIQKQGDLAHFQFRALNHWIDGGHNQIEVHGFHGAGQEFSRGEPFKFDADEPPVLLGNDFGANPVEYVLVALSACLTTTMVYHAAVNGIEIESVESSLEGDVDLHGFLDLDPTVRRGYREIRVNFRVKSDADREKLEMLAKKSPVFDIVTNPTPVRVDIQTSPRSEKEPEAA